MIHLSLSSSNVPTRPRWQRMPSSHVFYHRSPEHSNSYVLRSNSLLNLGQDVITGAHVQCTPYIAPQTPLHPHPHPMILSHFFRQSRSSLTTFQALWKMKKITPKIWYKSSPNPPPLHDIDRVFRAPVTAINHLWPHINIPDSNPHLLFSVLHFALTRRMRFTSLPCVNHSPTQGIR